MSEILNEAESLARHLVGAADASARELMLHGRAPVRYRMHPLDVEAIVTGLFPESDFREGDSLSITVLNLPVEPDEDVRLGEPVAEFDPDVLAYRRWRP